MPIINDGRSAYSLLEKTLSLQEAMHQDIRELHILIANLMPSPSRIATESRLGKLLGSTSLQVQLSYFRPKPLRIENNDPYIREVTDISDKYDVLIITGANVDRLPFSKVTFMDELSVLARKDFPVKIGMCWGGMALGHLLYGLDKKNYSQKKFGIFKQKKTAKGLSSHLLRNTNDVIKAPVSRWAGLNAQGLHILAESSQTGPYIVCNDDESVIMLANHPEYQTRALAQESFRDNLMPRNYFPKNDSSKIPLNTWRADAYILWGNIVEHIYDVSVVKK